MAVEKLFWTDPYLTECDAVVTSVGGETVRVDRTVAYAFSGGQTSDAGTIGEYPIVRAEVDGLDIVYTLPSGHGLSVGDSVRVAIDPVVRRRVMRLHFAAELVLEIITIRYGAPTKLGANISPDKARIDFAWYGSIADVFPEVTAEVARIVAQDLPIVSAFSDEAAQRRYWEIDGFARVPCGGTHPKTTGEVGAVRLARVNPGAGKERVEITLVD